MHFKIEKLDIPEVLLIKPEVFGDERGFFIETYRESEFKEAGVDFRFVQDNHSKSKKGVLRGIHYQLNPKAQGKLVRVIKGSLFDVAVDLRKDSKTFGKWVSSVLSYENNHMLWIPPGFGHGFCVLEDETEFLYKVTEEWDKDLDKGIIWNDSNINIKWPLDNPQLSQRDQNLPSLEKAEINF
ncbi:MAG: dTDP-4-dehydrorhamnose 3,5-epimerase [Pseudomonadota bacterium]